SGLYVQRDDPIMRLHRHDVPEIGFCHSGSGIWVVEGKVLPFSAGDVIVIAPSETHLARSSVGTVSEWTWIYYDPARLLGPAPGVARLVELSHLSGPSFVNLFPRERFPQINHLVCAVIGEFSRKQARWHSVIRGYMQTLLSLLHRHADSLGLRPDNDTNGARTADLRRIGPAVERICTGYGDKLDIESLAASCNLSVTHFRRRFTRATGRSPQAYVNDVRIGMASVALRATERTISEIALECGFTTLSSFNRLFKHVKGMTPREWRAQRG
ncbi:MAG: helix-turn-helix domain-containing protein, partial [Chitinivibrionales bacterium]|nr:helix-turn-helix domain-containing protein [Chitinivibrionales bacterium]